jgi:hypothetical protein
LAGSPAAKEIRVGKSAFRYPSVLRTVIEIIDHIQTVTRGIAIEFDTFDTKAGCIQKQKYRYYVVNSYTLDARGGSLIIREEEYPRLSRYGTGYKEKRKNQKRYLFHHRTPPRVNRWKKADI